jgi:osmotically-inducible protein OsmY
MRAARRSPDSPSPRPPPGSRAGLLARALFLALTALVAIPPAFSDDREAEQRDADSRQKLYIRRAFNDDATFKDHAGEVWVEVRGTTAVLSGKLPSAMLKQRAVFLAGQIKGIGEVRSDELLVAAPDGIPDLPSPFVEGVPPRGTLAGNSRDGHTTQAPRKSDLPGPDAAPASSPPSVTLLPLVPAVAPSPSPRTLPVVQMLPPRPLPDAPELASAVEALRRKEDRYSRLKADVRQKRVYLSGTVVRWDDVDALANAVRRLHGVEAVVVDRVQVDPNGR